MKFINRVAFLFFIVAFSSVMFGQTEPEVSKLRDLSIEELMNFEITTVTKFKRDIETVSTFVTVISSDQIKQMGARTIEDVLRIVPGYSVSITQFGLKQFEYRGFRSTNSAGIKFLIDGISLNNNVFGEATRVFDDMSLEGVERIEIIRGPGSAVHGSNAMLSVVNIITEKEFSDDKFEAGIKAGSFETYEPFFNFRKKLNEDFKFWGSVNYLDTKGPELDILQDRVSAYPFSLAPRTTDYSNKKTDIRVALQYKDLKLSTIYVNKSRAPFIGPSFALVERGKFKNREKYFLANLEHNFSLSDKLRFKNRLYYKKMYFSPDGQIFPSGFAEYDTEGNPRDINNDGIIDIFPDGMNATYELDDNCTGFEILGNWQASETHNLTAGIILEYDWLSDLHSRSNFNILVPGVPHKLNGYKEYDSGIVKESDRLFTAFNILDNWKILPDLSLELGFRYDYYDDFGSEFSPHFAFNFRPAKFITIKSLYDQSFRAPSFGELARTNNVNIEGNPDLKPEEVETFEVGFDLHLIKGISANFVAFWVKLDNQIVRVQKEIVTPGYPALMYGNRASCETEGFEFELNANPIKEVSAFANYTYQKPQTENSSSGNLKNAPSIPRHKANFGMTFSPSDWFDFNFTLNYIGEREREDGDNREAVESYIFASSTMIISSLIPDLSITASVYNLFDKEYFDPGHKVFVPNDYPRPGRNFLFGIKYNFGNL